MKKTPKTNKQTDKNKRKKQKNNNNPDRAYI